MANPLGVCSWSLTPDSATDLAGRVVECGLRRLQLALDPIRIGAWSVGGTRRALDDAGVSVLSGMIAMEGEDYSTPESIRATGGVRPDARWDANLGAARENAAIAREMGLALVTFHAGFIPEGADDPLRARMVERVAAIAGVFDERGVGVALETGQESAATLLGVLSEARLAGVGVNFDPANMALYGSGDPIEALRLLAPRVVQLHLKDALPPARAGEWGTEVPLGEGVVDWAGFFEILDASLPNVSLIVEREDGEDRIADVRRAVELAERYGAAR